MRSRITHPTTHPTRRSGDTRPSPALVMLDLPEHYHAEIVEISPWGEDRCGPEAFCALLDEMYAELKEDPENGSFFYNRSSLLKAYGEKRLYGLWVKWSEEMLEHKSFDDPIFVKKHHGMVHRVLPCFIVLDKEFDCNSSVCHYLWTAKRARNKGMAKEMLDFFDVRSVDNPLPEAQVFWERYFEHVQAEVALGDAALLAMEQPVEHVQAGVLENEALGPYP
jgi:hypothetical protein